MKEYFRIDKNDKIIIIGIILRCYRNEDFEIMNKYEVKLAEDFRNNPLDCDKIIIETPPIIINSILDIANEFIIDFFELYNEVSMKFINNTHLIAQKYNSILKLFIPLLILYASKEEQFHNRMFYKTNSQLRSYPRIFIQFFNLLISSNKQYRTTQQILEEFLNAYQNNIKPNYKFENRINYTMGVFNIGLDSFGTSSQVNIHSIEKYVKTFLKSIISGLKSLSHNRTPHWNYNIEIIKLYCNNNLKKNEVFKYLSKLYEDLSIEENQNIYDNWIDLKREIKELNEHFILRSKNIKLDQVAKIKESVRIIDSNSKDTRIVVDSSEHTLARIIMFAIQSGIILNQSSFLDIFKHFKFKDDEEDTRTNQFYENCDNLINEILNGNYDEIHDNQFYEFTKSCATKVLKIGNIEEFIIELLNHNIHKNVNNHIVHDETRNHLNRIIINTAQATFIRFLDLLIKANIIKDQPSLIHIIKNFKLNNDPDNQKTQKLNDSIYKKFDEISGNDRNIIFRKFTKLCMMDLKIPDLENLQIAIEEEITKRKNNKFL